MLFHAGMAMRAPLAVIRLAWSGGCGGASMKLFILAVGRGRTAPEQELATGWLARLPQGGELIEVESKLLSLIHI